VYRDPLEPKLTADVSAAALMQHVRTIGSWQRESGSPGEAQAFDYIERTLESYGVDVERDQIEAYISLPQEARLTLPDGSVIEASPLVLDVGRTRRRGRRRRRWAPEDFAHAGWENRARAPAGLAGPRGATRQAGTLGQIWVLMEHLRHGRRPCEDARPRHGLADSTTPCLSILGVDGSGCGAAGQWAALARPRMHRLDAVPTWSVSTGA
jgi:hypothetical protein